MTSSTPHTTSGFQPAGTGQSPAYPGSPAGPGHTAYSGEETGGPGAASWNHQGAEGAYQQPGPPPGYAPQPGPYPAAYGPYPQPPQGKSRIAAGLLGLLLGWLGAHNFYLGHISKACTQLGLTIIGVVAYIVAFFMFFPLSFSSLSSSLFLAAPLIMLVGSALVMGATVWGLIEGILILVATPGIPPWGVDAYGVPVRS